LKGQSHGLSLLPLLPAARFSNPRKGVFLFAFALVMYAITSFVSRCKPTTHVCSLSEGVQPGIGRSQQEHGRHPDTAALRRHPVYGKQRGVVGAAGTGA